MSNLDYVKSMLAETADVSVEYIVKTLGVTKPYAYALLSKGRKELKMFKKDGEWTHKTRTQSNRPEGMTAAEEKEIIADIEQAIAQHDAVNHPPHYKVGGIETIDFIEAKGLSYNLGNVIKYISRADHKGERRENLEKARWYLEREISKLK